MCRNVNLLFKYFLRKVRFAYSRLENAVFIETYCVVLAIVSITFVIFIHLRVNTHSLVYSPTVVAHNFTQLAEARSCTSNAKPNPKSIQKMPKMEKVLRYNGRFINKKQYKRRIKQSEGGKQRIKNVPKEDENQSVVEARRIVEIDVIAQHLYCTCCKEMLLLEDIEKK